MATATTEKAEAKVVSPAEWLAARKQLLAKEKEFTRLRDQLSRQRRAMPWEKIEKNYIFEGSGGRVTLAELFDGKSQLIVYHFMFGPGWKEGCPSCSFLADSFDGAVVHLAHRDTAFTAISRATLPEIEAFKKRMGWRFPWVTSHGTDFNHDFGVSYSKEEIAGGKKLYNYGTSGFTGEEGPGASVFFKKGSDIFHTYSTYARGLDILLPTYNWLDMTAQGRDEEGIKPYPMAWVRHHDRYNEHIDIKAIAKLL